jgi:hypothetical protein
MENNKRRGSEERIVLAHPTMVYDKDRRFNYLARQHNNQQHTMIRVEAERGQEDLFPTGHSHQWITRYPGTLHPTPLKMPDFRAYCSKFFFLSGLKLMKKWLHYSVFYRPEYGFFVAG